MVVEREFDKNAIPFGLSSAGKELWTGVTSGRELDAPSKVLLVNACRIADRLDDLVETIGSRLTVINDQGTETINPLISEHRQQYATLAAILSKMGLGELPKSKSGPSKWDELARRRQNRNAVLQLKAA